MRSWLVVPSGSSVTIVSAPDLTPVATVDAAPTTVHALADDGSAFAYAEGAEVTVVGGLLGGSPRVEATVRTPAKVDALAIRGDVVFVGGFGADDPSFVDSRPSLEDVRQLFETEGSAQAERFMMRPRFGFIDRASNEYVPIALPHEVSQLGKSIDGLAFAGDKLVVVDDVVLPKYLLSYDVGQPRAPRHLLTKSFEWTLIRSQVRSVADDGVTLAILESHNRGTHVAIVRLDDLRFHGGIRVPSADDRQTRGGAREASGMHAVPLDVRAVAVADTTLFLAARGAGLAWIDLSLLIQPRSYTFQGKLVEDVSKLDLGAESIRRLQVPDGPVVDVVAVDATRAYAVVERDGGYHGVLVQLAP